MTRGVRKVRENWNFFGADLASHSSRCRGFLDFALEMRPSIRADILPGVKIDIFCATGGGWGCQQVLRICQARGIRD